MTKLFAATDFQQWKIAELRIQPFEELSGRPAREQLATPPNLPGLKVFVCRRAGDNGGIEITVEVQKRALLVFVESSVDGFEILPDGRILPLHEDTHDD
jgi:hypothetical protein